MRLNLFSFTLNSCQNELLIAQHRCSHNRLYSSLELIIRRQRNSLRSVSAHMIIIVSFWFSVIYDYRNLSQVRARLIASMEHFAIGINSVWTWKMVKGHTSSPCYEMLSDQTPIKLIFSFWWHWHGTPSFVESFYQLQWYSTDSDERKHKCYYVMWHCMWMWTSKLSASHQCSRCSSLTDNNTY